MPAPMTAPIPRVTRASGPSSRRSVPAPAWASSAWRSFLTKSDMASPELDAGLYTINRYNSPGGQRPQGEQGMERPGGFLLANVRRKNASKPMVRSEQGRRGSGASERANRLYDSLRNMIVRGQLAPGSRIVETEVAERFGVSRTPVRAAFQRLEREGYVVASPTPQARMTVRPLP